MLKLFFLAITVSLLVADVTLPKDLQNFIKEHKNIVLGTNINWDPYVIVKNDGNITGYDSDILKLINHYTGANFLLKAGKWSEIQQAAKEGKIDGLSTLTETEERDKWLNFSPSYISIRKTILTSVNNNIAPINSLSQLKGKTVVILKANMLEEKLAKKLEMHIVYAPTVKDMYKYIIDEQYPFVFGSSTTEYLLGKFGLPQLKKVYDFPKAIALKFALRKDLKEAMEILKIGLSRIPYEEFQRVEKKWFLNNSTFTEWFLNKEEVRYLKSKKEINICLEKNFAPFFFKEDGEHKGLLVEVLQNIQKDIESKFNFTTDTCDVTPTETLIEPNRASDITPYFTQSLVLATKENQPFLEDIKNKNYKICVIDGFKYSDILKQKYPNLEILKVETRQQAFEYVKESKVFGYVDLLGVIAYHLQNTNNTKIKISSKLDINIGLLLYAEDKTLMTILGKTIEKLGNQKIKNIYYKWIDIEIKEVVNYGFLKEVLLFMLFFILVSLYWFKKLSTAKKELEISQEEIDQINKNLEKRVALEVEKTTQKDMLLMQENRLAQMGEMISMIAHQWRQPLNIISLKSSMLKMKAKKNKIERELIIDSADEIIKILQYLSSTIDDFRDFFKPTKVQTETNFDAILQNVFTLIETSLTNANITVVKELHSNAEFFTYKNELMQVIINLMKNAQDILEDKKIKNPYIKIKTYDTKEHYTLEISDNGGGINAAIITKIFDPYFSTKTNLQGTGLGLYMSKIIIEKHCYGELSVSNSDDGAVFKIELKRTS